MRRWNFTGGWALLVATVFGAACASQQTTESDESAQGEETSADKETDSDSGDSGSEAPTSGTASGRAELIPLEKFFADPDHYSVQISPDGSKIAWLGPSDGAMNIWVAPTDDIDGAEAVTDEGGDGIQSYTWAYDGKHLLYETDKAGNEKFHVYSLNLETGESRDLTPVEGVSAHVLEVGREEPGEILVIMNDRNPKYHEVYRVDIATGERERVVENTEETAFSGDHYVADQKLRVRLAARFGDDGAVRYMTRRDGEWKELFQVPPEDNLTTEVVDVDTDRGVAYAIDSRDRNLAALVEIDLETGDRKVVFEPEKADVSSAVVDPKDEKLQAAVSEYKRRRVEHLDETFREHFEQLESAAEGEPAVRSRSSDGQHWVVRFRNDDEAYRYYHYDAKNGEATHLFPMREALVDLPLAQMHPVVIEARDGLKIVSYLSLPPWLDEGGRPSEPIPLVVDVHGGPHARAKWSNHPVHQAFANRGYAVLSPNYRGSTGFGKKFLNAGDREAGRKMQQDLTDAVKWAIEENIADSDRVAIQGASWGGYSTLMGLATTPDLYACGVDRFGPVNLVTLLEAIPPYWTPFIEMMAQRIGEFRTDEGRKFLESRSPVTHADQIDDPLLVVQGGNDPRVPPSETEQILEALKGSDVPVTYLYYPDEGHGLRQPANRLTSFAAMEQFFGKCIGGRTGDWPDDVGESSVEVRRGAEYVPRLKEAVGQ